jgi:hypothetical protein
VSLVEARYDRLAPSIEYLTDEVVLAQAWKKTEHYVRWHNWYADVLALDLVVLTIESDLTDWAARAGDPDFRPEPMQVVPAPKNCPWAFPASEGDSPSSGDWAPKEARQPLRPLAHLTARDQTLAMGLVLCFADAVETLQGPTEQSDASAAREQGVYSYGNRLWCDWQTQADQAPRARFRWGSAATYSKFSEDYQRFLARPAELARIADARRRAERVIYVVELDLKRFFDRIDRERLLFRLARIWHRYARHFGHRDRPILSPDFIDAARRIMDWEWAADAEAHATLFADEASADQSGGLPTGLPQGLVASGFLSNAYMLRFDRWIGKRLGLGKRLILHDYCRYVDDIRLVVEVDREMAQARVVKLVTRRIQARLDRYCTGLDDAFKLRINGDKTKVVPWAD